MKYALIARKAECDTPENHLIFHSGCVSHREEFSVRYLNDMQHDHAEPLQKQQ